jgi:hypothetical protein
MKDRVFSLNKKHGKLDGGELPEGGQVCKPQSRCDPKWAIKPGREFQIPAQS